MPECKKLSGCELEKRNLDDDALERDAWSFLTAMKLHEVTGLPDVQRIIFETLGLIEDPDTLLELITLYLAHRTAKQDKDIYQT